MNSQIVSTEITELVCTRISHDLIGNIGATANAVELLEEGDMDFLDDIKSILKSSSSVLSARLKFFRMAFGLGNANLEDISAVCKACNDYLATTGNKNYPVDLQMDITNVNFSRAAMLSVMILADTIVKGGWIKIEEKEGKLYAVSFSNNDPSKEKTDTIKKISSDENTEKNAQFAPMFYLKEILRNEHYDLTFADDRLLGFVIG